MSGKYVCELVELTKRFPWLLAQRKTKKKPESSEAQKERIAAARKRLAEAKVRMRRPATPPKTGFTNDKENVIFEAPGFFVVSSPLRQAKKGKENLIHSRFRATHMNPWCSDLEEQMTLEQASSFPSFGFHQCCICLSI